MQSNLEQSLRSTIRLQRIALTLFALGLLAVLVLWLNGKKGAGSSLLHPDYVTGMVDSESIAGRQAFLEIATNTTMKDNQGVAYRLSDIREYLDSGKFDEIQNKHLEHMKDGGVSIPANCVWALGYVWKYGKGANGKEGLGFFVVPMLTDTSSGTVLNYFDPANDKYYFHPKKGELNTIYDEGNLFP
ncbi:hypothetical protein [Flaviaesturariibacter terrae]